MTDSPSKNIPYLDGWRGIAIILVLQSHFLLGGGGRLGVDLFFVLSGYLMSDLLFIKKVSIGVFFIRRINRILPTFWLYTLVISVYASTLQPELYQVPLSELLSTISFCRTYFPADLSIWADNWAIGHFWSLNVEEHSYLFLALLALIVRKIRTRDTAVIFLGLATVVVLLVNCLYFIHPPTGRSPWFARSECASLGLIASAAIRLFRHNVHTEIFKNVHGAVPVVMLFAGVAFLGPLSFHILDITIAPICLAIAINYLDCAPAFLLRLLALPVLRLAGIASFSLYIWQQPFFLAYAQFGLQRQIAGGLALLVGVAVFKWIENPARLYLNKRWTAPARDKSSFA